MADERDPGEDQTGPRFDTGRLLLVAVLVLAVACTAVLVVTSSAQWLRLGVLGGLWAAMLGVFLATRYRKQVVDREAEAAELQSVYQLELEREVAARREYELEIEAETRRRVQEESQDNLSALRAELMTLRETLERLTGGEVLVERFALRAQSTRMRPLSEMQPPRMVTAGDPGRARQVLAGDTINAGTELLEPLARPPVRTQVVQPNQYRPEPRRPGVGVRAGQVPPRRDPGPPAPVEQSNPGIAAALSGSATNLVRPVAPPGQGSGHREPVAPRGVDSGYRSGALEEPGRRAAQRPEIGRPAPGGQRLETQRTDARLPGPPRPPAERPGPRPDAPRRDSQRMDPSHRDAQLVDQPRDSQRLDPPVRASQRMDPPRDSQRMDPPRRDSQRLDPQRPTAQPPRGAEPQPLQSNPAEPRPEDAGSQRLDLRPRPTDSQRIDLRPQPPQAPLRPAATPARAEARPPAARPAPVRPRHRNVEDSGAPLFDAASGPMPLPIAAPKPAPLRAVPADPEPSRATGGRRRAEDRPTPKPAPARSALEDTGAHTEGRSVTELLAAHGVEDTGAGRRRRRAAD